jgi:NhaA family Na+:H+ antiporter
VSLTAIRDFMRHEAASGIILVAAAALAMLMDNSPLAPIYDGLLSVPAAVQIGALAISKPLLLWINDGLMAVFFLLVGLEIKREMLEGELSSLRQAALPGLAAVGGMAVPALVFAAINMGDPEALRGWAIPAATDIAFALGVLALLGPRVPISLKVFLLALAIIDDLGAIVIIAIFYTADLGVVPLALASIGILGLFVLNRLGVTRPAAYILVGIAIWVCVLKSGVHATLAGVALAFAIPMRDRSNPTRSPLKAWEHLLHPWVAYGIMPVFAFANAGVSLTGFQFSDLFAPLPLGIALGLFLGKQLGICGAVWLAVRTGLARLPEDVNWMQIYGVSLLAGIGFTMSLFIGSLAFSDPEHAAMVRIGVIFGSLLSGVGGFVILRFAVRAGPDTAFRPRASNRTIKRVSS